jgi:hypothetical protein
MFCNKTVIQRRLPVNMCFFASNIQFLVCGSFIKRYLARVLKHATINMSPFCVSQLKTQAQNYFNITFTQQITSNKIIEGGAAFAMMENMLI